jgi:glycosyltransferase involved in cell wall biosynthesis
MNKKSIIYLVNVDYFFLSHRLPLALEAKKRGYEVYVAAQNTGKFGEFEKHGIQLIDLPIGRGIGGILSFFRSLLVLCWLYSRIKPDVIHQISVKPIIIGTFASALFSRESRIINAVTGLGYSFADEGRSFLRFSILTLLKFVVILGNKEMTFLFQNVDDKNLYLRYGLSTPSNSIIIKGAGVDEVTFKRDLELSDEKEKVKITLLSRMLKDKGVMEFLNAAHLLRSKLEGIAVFRLVGGLDLDNPAFISKETIVNLLVPDYIVWEGNRNDIKRVYQATDIACLPSYREGMPKSLIEAMAMSCPVITTLAPGCRCCVDEGVNGFLVPVKNVDLLANRILLLASNADLRAKMGLASRKKMVLEMTLNEVIDKTFALYEA